MPTDPGALPRLLDFRVVGRELLRVACAFAVYLALRPLWTWSGLHALHERALLAAAERLFVPMQHFPVVPDLRGLTLRNLDFLVVFLVGLTLVARGMPWGLRLRRFAFVLVGVFVLHVVTVVLQLRVHAAVDLHHRYDLLVLLPWEFAVVDRLRYLLYDLGLQIGPFLLALLWAYWNWSGDPGRRAADPAPRRGRRMGSRAAVACGAAAVILVGALLVWASLRESNPLHVGAHARLGRIYFENGNLPGAREQYRIAVEGGTPDLSPYYDLARIEHDAGNSEQAAALLRKGRDLAAHDADRQRFRSALEQLGRGASAARGE